MHQLILWFFAGIGASTTFFVILFFGVILFYKARSRALCIPILEIVHQREQQEPWGVSEIAQILEKRGQFPKYIPQLFELYTPLHLTADACYDATEAKFITDVGAIIPHYRLSDKGYEVLRSATIHLGPARVA